MSTRQRITPHCAAGIRYALPRRRADASRRLLELLLYVEPEGDPGYLETPEPGLFAVVDLRTGNRGVFEADGYDADRITGMVAGFFDSQCRQVAPRVWAA